MKKEVNVQISQENEGGDATYIRESIEQSEDVDKKELEKIHMLSKNEGTIEQFFARTKTLLDNNDFGGFLKAINRISENQSFIFSNPLNLTETDTIEVYYSYLPVVDLNIRFMVQVLTPILSIPEEKIIVGNPFLPDANANLESLKILLLKEWHKNFKNKKRVLKKIGAEWVLKVNKVKLIECNLLVPKEICSKYFLPLDQCYYNKLLPNDNVLFIHYCKKDKSYRSLERKIQNQNNLADLKDLQSQIKWANNYAKQEDCDLTILFSSSNGIRIDLRD